MAKYKVLITDLGYTTYEPEREILEAVGAELVLKECKSEKEIIEHARDADALIARRAEITAAVIEKLERCRVMARYGVGYDNIDIKAAAARGIPVCNVPDYCMEEVSDQALGLLLSCVRKITTNDKKIRQGAWNITGANPVYRIRGKVMGIIGLGRIGQVFLRKVKAFEFGKILVCDPYLDQDETARTYGVTMVRLEALLTEADYISLHVPLTDETHHMINASALEKMKESAMLVNTSRGPVVKLEDLYQALKAQKINSAGIDVWEPEPPPKDSPLFSLDNIVVSDHAAWYSEDSEHSLKVKMAETIADALSGKGIRNVVNGVG